MTTGFSDNRSESVRVHSNGFVGGRVETSFWTSAQVSRLLIEHSPDGTPRCTGVQVWTGQELVTVNAAREVILSAGSIGSPQILQLSGIGPSNLLRKFSIPVVHELAGVGENLHDHLQIRMVWKVNGKTLNERATREELDITAVSIHAYAYVADKYALLSCGASMGDNYGPMVVTPSDRSIALRLRARQTREKRPPALIMPIRSMASGYRSYAITA